MEFVRLLTLVSDRENSSKLKRLMIHTVMDDAHGRFTLEVISDGV